MLHFSFKTLGIELNDERLKMVFLNQKGARVKAESSINLQLSPGWIVNGMVESPEELKALIRQNLKKGYRIPNKVNLLTPSQHVVTRYLRLPPVNKRLLARLVQNEVEKNLIFPFNEPLWDYHDLGESFQEPGKKDVLLVAAPSDILNSQIEFFKTLGIRVNAVDIRGIALNRLVHWMKLQDKSPAYAIMHLGISSMDLSIYYQGALRLNRNVNYVSDISMGGLSSIVQDLANELSRSINFFKYSIMNQDIAVEHLWLTGEFAANQEQLIESLRDSGRTVEWLISPSIKGRELRITDSNLTPIGLAMKKGGYRK